MTRQSTPSDGYDQAALDAASREVHMMLLREGSDWGTKACEEMGRVFMTAYLKAAPVSERGPSPQAIKAAKDWEAGVPAQDVDVNAMVAYILHPQSAERNST